MSSIWLVALDTVLQSMPVVEQLKLCHDPRLGRQARDTASHHSKGECCDRRCWSGMQRTACTLC